MVERMAIRRRVVIIGAAGRDFHTFNMLFRGNRAYSVVAFTAAQIPFISNRRYPASLAGRLYPKGIGIVDESELGRIIRRHGADICVQAYSDVEYAHLMHIASIANSAGADFWLVAPQHTMIKARKPVIAVCATRTGSGKSQTVRYIAARLRRRARIGIIRHPMPYGYLARQAVERFAGLDDFERHNCTIEEREEYEEHVRNGFVVYAGVDYRRIVALAEKESDLLIWDGGNNDAPFIAPDLLITVVDPLRGSGITSYYPSETVARLADMVVVNKANAATRGELKATTASLTSINSRAAIVHADSVVSVESPNAVKGKRVLIVEDGPTLTHGGMATGAGSVAAKIYGARTVVDARRYAVGSIKETLAQYPHIGRELPAMGYSRDQTTDLEKTINNARCDIVLYATPIDLGRIINANKPMVRVRYELKPRTAALDKAIERFAKAML